MTINEFIETYHPCQDAADWLVSKKLKDMNQAWQKCERGDWMMWTLRKIQYSDRNTLILLACDFAEHVLPQYENVLQNDSRPRNAIQTARNVVSGKATRRDAAYAAAYAADAARAADAAARAADAAAYAADAADATAYAADAAAYAADAARADGERKWQAEQIRKYIKNPF